jgi:ArsR family transcriptional regulator
MVSIFKALSDETRLRILSLILNGEMCVCEIEYCLKLTQSNASRHLTTLKNAGLLLYTKKAQWAYYTINENFKKENRELWEYLLCKLKELPEYQTDCDAYKKCKAQNLCNK